MNLVQSINSIYNSILNNIDNVDPLRLNQIVDTLINLSTVKEENYYILKVDDHSKIQLLILYSIYYHTSSSNFKRNYVGLDFEFNEHKIALCQAAFYLPLKDNTKFIFIFNPLDMSSSETELIIKYLFISKNIYKLVHGSDSLDIPYIFQELFMNNHEYIFNFVKRVIDIRFMCEYNKIISKEDDKKCSLYDALLHYNVIDQEKHDYLVDTNKSLLVITGVNWNVHDMSDNHLIYAYYDVFYLYKLYRKINKHNSRYVLLLTRFIYLEKWHISNMLVEIKKQVDPMNNYIIKSSNDENLTLINIFNLIMEDPQKIIITIKNEKIVIDDLLGINYFKTPLILLFKLISYSILCDKYSVYKNKQDTFNEKLDLKYVFDTFKLIHLPALRRIVKSFYKFAYKKISKLNITNIQ